jgi:AraC-like DNA-binding protein
VIVDPSADGTTNVDEVAGILTQYPSMPLVVYVPLTASSFMAVSQLSRRGLEHVLLYRLDDAPDHFRETLERACSNPLTRELLTALASRLDKLPTRLGRAVMDVFEKPDRYASAIDLAMSAEVSYVRLYRSFEAAELVSPKKILTAAKLLRGYSYLGDPGYSIREVAMKLGYRHPRIFTEHSVEVFGVTPSRLRLHLAPSDAVSKMLDWLQIRKAAQAVSQRAFR